MKQQQNKIKIKIIIIIITNKNNKILYEVGKGGGAFLFSGSGSIISLDYMIFFRLYLSIVRIRLSMVSFDNLLSIVSFDRQDSSFDCIFRSSGLHPPRQIRFSFRFLTSPSHWIFRRVLTDRVTRMAKMKRTRKGGFKFV